MKDDDAISRQAVLDMMQMRMGGKELYKAVYELPPAQPEIVRCKDCKLREVKNGFCEGRGWPMQLVPDDGFCEKGERRDESRRDGIKK